MHARRDQVELRHRCLRLVLRIMTILPFDKAVIGTYGDIVRVLGFSRRLIMDRLIAATAIVHDLPLATMDLEDFRAIPDLRLAVWPAQ